MCAGKQFDDGEEKNCLVCECNFCISVLRVVKFQVSKQDSRHYRSLRGNTAGAETSAE